MTDIQEIYARLLARDYQRTVFSSLKIDRTEKRGVETLTNCPYCQDEKHFSYNSQKPVFKCWKCNKSGDWLNFMQDIQGLTFTEALQELAKAAGVEMQISEKQERRYESYIQKANILETAQDIFLQELENSKELNYLLDRGYSREEIQDMELGAYTDRAKLQEALRAAGYSDGDIKDSGLLTQGLGASHSVSILYRDKAGRAIGLACRAIDPETSPKYKYSYGLKKSEGLVGLERARGAETVVLIEGLLDALLISSKDIPAVATGGTQFSTAQMEALKQNATKEVLLAMDMDEPGKKATCKAIEHLRWNSKLKAYVVSWSDYKDPDEMIRTAGLEAFQEALRKAESSSSWMARYLISQHDITEARGLDKALYDAMEYYSDSISDPIDKKAFYLSMRLATGLDEEALDSRLLDHEDRAAERRKSQIMATLSRELQEASAQGDIVRGEALLNMAQQSLSSSRGVEIPDPYLVEKFNKDILTTEPGLKTGYQDLDRIISIPRGALTIVAGRPRHGKTTLQLNLLSKLLDKYPEEKFYLFSYEEAKKYLVLKLLLIWSGVTLNSDFNQEAFINYMKEKRGSNQKIEKAISKYEQLTSSGRLIISDKMLAAPDLASTIGLVCQRGDVGAIFIDYIQRIPPGVVQSVRYLEIKNTSSLLLEQAVSNDVSIVLGAQLSRKSGSGADPKLEDLRESGDIEQDASLVLGLYNGTVENLQDGKQPIQKEQDIKVSVLKQRAGASGRSVTLTMNAPALQITDKTSERVY